MIQLPLLLLSLSLVSPAKDSVLSRDSSHLKPVHVKMKLTQVLQTHTEKWMEIPGVIGTGEGKSDGKPCIMIFVDHKSETLEKKIPHVVYGYTVVFEETGKIEAR